MQSKLTTVSEVKEIEKRWVSKDKTLHANVIFEAAKLYYFQIDALPVREKSGVAKQAGFYTIEPFKSGLDGVENLELTRKIVSEAMSLMHSPENFARSFSKITLKC